MLSHWVELHAARLLDHIRFVRWVTGEAAAKAAVRANGAGRLGGSPFAQAIELARCAAHQGHHQAPSYTVVGNVVVDRLPTAPARRLASIPAQSWCTHWASLHRKIDRDAALSQAGAMNQMQSALQSRRQFLARTAMGAAGAAWALNTPSTWAHVPGERPGRAPEVTVLNPRARVPVSFIIDDSTCLVNLNRFAIPQFDAAFGGGNKAYHINWREWPVEIPDAFVRRFAEWCAEHGVKGKYSVVPYPACVGRLDRLLPGWTQRELDQSLELVRTVLVPNWDIHPEMVTHTRVIDLRTGHPYPDYSLKFMENWDWTTGRSVDEIASYMAYALQILKNVGLPCEGITTPGGFGNRARPQLAQATLEAVRAVFGAEVPHYFRDAYEQGPESVAPRVEYASGLDGPDPRCVVSVIACTGDWTGGWDCTPPGGADRFITADGQSGRLVEVIQRGEPALLLAHWTGIYFNGAETGFKIFQEVVRRLHARFDHLHWMKLSEVARYWAARQLTRIELDGGSVRFKAPFACPEFTVRWETTAQGPVRLRVGPVAEPLREVNSLRALIPGSWCREQQTVTACFALPKGSSQLEMGA